jgi:hypothetical protein
LQGLDVSSRYGNLRPELITAREQQGDKAMSDKIDAKNDEQWRAKLTPTQYHVCLLYTSDAADDTR